MKITVLLVFFSLFHFNAYSAQDISQYNHYQWDGKSQNWYEWWYYKTVIPETNESFYFVYGVVNPADTKQERKATRSYVGFGNFNEKTIITNHFNVNDFNANQNQLSVQIGNQNKNFALENHIQGDLIDDKHHVHWNIQIENKWSFNAMGWGMFIKNLLNIYWFPAQASAVMNGEIIYDNKVYKLENAPAYQDRNWGVGFPKRWAWIVSNQFKDSPGTSLAVGGGKPKVFNFIAPLQSVVVGFNVHGKEYAFRPNSGSIIHTEISYGKWNVKAKNIHGDQIEILATAPKEKFMCLKFMTPQGDEFNDYETLTGNVKVKFKAKNDKIWTNYDSSFAGIEYGTFESEGLSSIYNSSLNFD